MLEPFRPVRLLCRVVERHVSPLAWRLPGRHSTQLTWSTGNSQYPWLAPLPSARLAVSHRPQAPVARSKLDALSGAEISSASILVVLLVLRLHTVDFQVLSRFFFTKVRILLVRKKEQVPAFGLCLARALTETAAQLCISMRILGQIDRDNSNKLRLRTCTGWGVHVHTHMRTDRERARRHTSADFNHQDR